MSDLTQVKPDTTPAPVQRDEAALLPPVDVIEDDRALSEWAGTSIEVASKK